jgi:hypothetical protein
MASGVVFKPSHEVYILYGEQINYKISETNLRRTLVVGTDFHELLPFLQNKNYVAG